VGSYALDYDFARDSLVQQRILGYYNAQCCGIAVEYQTYNFPFFDPVSPCRRIAASTSRSRWLAWAPSRTSSAPWAAQRNQPRILEACAPLIVSTRQTTMSRAGQPLKPDAQ